MHVGDVADAFKKAQLSQFMREVVKTKPLALTVPWLRRSVAGLLAAQARAKSQGSPCGMCGG
jgi:hypothetical protein